MKTTFICLMLSLCGSVVNCAAQKPSVKDMQLTTKPVVQYKNMQDNSMMDSDDQDGHGKTTDWTPEIVVHLLSLIEQHNSKMDRLEVNMENLNSKFDKIESQVVSMNKKMLEMNLIANDGLKEVKSQVFAVEERLKSAVSSVLYQMEDKIKLQFLQFGGSTGQKTTEAAADCTHSSEIVVKQDLGRIKEDILVNITVGLDKLGQAMECDDRDNSSVNKIGTSFGSNKKLLEKIEKRVTNISVQLQDKLNTDLTTKESKQGEPLTKQRSATGSGHQDSQQVLREIVRPSKCVRGMIALPYTVIHPDNSSVITTPYVCDSQTDGGGWIVFQRRQSGSVDFYLNWSFYKNGFGSLIDEFWLGLDALHNLTRTWTYELRIDLRANGKPYYAHYSTFAVSSESELYVLQLGNYTGNAGDMLGYHRWMPFSTKEKDNDKNSGNCATGRDSAWWYKSCDYSDLNRPNPQNGGLYWSGLSRVTYSEMKMRRVDHDSC